MKYFPKDFKRLDQFTILHKIMYSTIDDIEYRAMYNWALRTCIEEILKSSYPAVVVCEEFIERMDDAAWLSNDPDIRRSWFICKDAGEYLMDCFIETNEEYNYKVEKVYSRLKKRRNKYNEATNT